MGDKKCARLWCHYDHWEIKRYIFPFHLCFPSQGSEICCNKNGYLGRTQCPAAGALIQIYQDLIFVSRDIASIEEVWEQAGEWVTGKEKYTLARGLFWFMAGTQARANRRVKRQQHSLQDRSKEVWERLMLMIRFREPSFVVQHEAPRSVSSRGACQTCQVSKTVRNLLFVEAFWLLPKGLGETATPGQKASSFIIWRKTCMDRQGPGSPSQIMFF